VQQVVIEQHEGHDGYLPLIEHELRDVLAPEEVAVAEGAVDELSRAAQRLLGLLGR